MTKSTWDGSRKRTAMAKSTSDKDGHYNNQSIDAIFRQYTTVMNHLEMKRGIILWRELEQHGQQQSDARPRDEQHSGLDFLTESVSIISPPKSRIASF
jgi:hypothetical protein